MTPEMKSIFATVLAVAGTVVGLLVATGMVTMFLFILAVIFGGA